MTDKERQVYAQMVSSRDQAWASIREHRDHLSSIMIDKRKMALSDLPILLKCILLTIAESWIFRFDVPDIKEDLLVLIQDRSVSGLLKRVQFESKNIQIIEDNNSTAEQKAEAIQLLRKSVWGSMASEFESVVALMFKYPYVTDAKEIMLLYRCVDAVLCTFEIEDKNLELICPDE